MAEGGRALRDAAYAMCRRIISVPRRAAIQRALGELEAAQGSPSQQMTNNLGYVGRRQHAQFYGYLVASENIGDTSYPFPLLPLSEEQRAVFLAGHASTVFLNEVCLSPLLTDAPYIAKAVDPYSRFKTLSCRVDPAPFIITPDEAVKVSEAFARSRPAAIVRATPAEIRKRLSTEDTAQMVRRLEDDIVNAGPMGTPEELAPLRATLRPGTNGYAMAQYWYALTSIRGMLRALDEMLFSATLHDHIATLTDKSIFGMDGPMSNSVGVSYTFDCQPQGGLLRTEPGAIILILPGLPDVSERILALIESVQVSFDQETGLTQRLDIRELDHDLNPYSRLIMS